LGVSELATSFKSGNSYPLASLKTESAFDPKTLRPMLATRGHLPATDSEWAYEIKWDGYRALCFVDDGTVRLFSRNNLETTARFAYLARTPESWVSERAIFDGEIVALTEAGIPSFALLQQHQKHSATLKYIVFDILALNDSGLLGEPWEKRRKLLESVIQSDARWELSLVHDKGAELLEVTKDRGFEGIVAKKRNSRYEPGKRSNQWIKIKNSLGQEVVIGGWTEGEGSRSNWFGALLVGYFEEDGATLRYAGRVGSGFGNLLLRDLHKKLSSLEQSENPFSDPVPSRRTHFVKPELVAEVDFTEWTSAGIMRQPTFKGLRIDKPAHEVRKESS
jgi:bifunctional non-homologous end joining protein LigD